MDTLYCFRYWNYIATSDSKDKWKKYKTNEEFWGTKHGVNLGFNYGNNYGENHNKNYGANIGVNHGENFGINYGDNYGINYEQG